MDKLAALIALGMKRKAGAYPGYYDVTDFHGGAYESVFVSPYTKSARNVDAALAFVLQDWASYESLQGPLHGDRALYGHDPERITNKNLKRQLRQTFGWELADVFATNLFPFIKPGGISNAIPQGDYGRAFDEFCWPQIQIVNPRGVVCLGASVYNAFAKGLGFPPSRGVGDSFAVDGKIVWHQYHPTARCGRRLMDRAWADMKRSLIAVTTG